MERKGYCTSGISCSGDCCKSIEYINNNYIEIFCDYYDKITGLCKVYDKRNELGFIGCIIFPDSPAQIANIKNCGFYFIDEDDNKV